MSGPSLKITVNSSDLDALKSKLNAVKSELGSTIERAEVLEDHLGRIAASLGNIGLSQLELCPRCGLKCSEFYDWAEPENERGES